MRIWRPHQGSIGAATAHAAPVAAVAADVIAVELGSGAGALRRLAKW